MGHPASPGRQPRVSAFFDMDKTLISENSGSLYMRYRYQRGEIGEMDLLKGIGAYLQYKIGILDIRSWTKRMMVQFRGESEAALKEQANQWFEAMVAPTIYPEAVELVRAHRDEVSLVMLKPDNFERRSRRPGNIIDAFSLTGLRIVAAKLFRMTVAMGERFYGPLKELFVDKLRFLVARTAKEKLSDAFDFPFNDADADRVADMLAERNAECEFNKIVEYMTGVHPNSVAEEEKPAAGNARCLALLYEGPKAIEGVRSVLGSTDPSKAEPGTVRSDFGRDLMRNGAHASDSPENALRERQIVGLDKTESDTCDVKEIIKDYLAS